MRQPRTVGRTPLPGDGGAVLPDGEAAENRSQPATGFPASPGRAAAPRCNHAAADELPPALVRAKCPTCSRPLFRRSPADKWGT